MKIRSSYRKSKLFRTYEDPKQEFNFLTFLRRRGLADDADFLTSFNGTYYSNSNSHIVRQQQGDAMNRVVVTTADNHKEVDDYMLSDYVSGMMVNAERLVIQFDEEVKQDLPRSNTPGVAYLPLTGALHTYIGGKLSLEKLGGRRPASAWKFTRFFAGDRQVELFFRNKSEAESYAKYYESIYKKLCW